MKKVIISITAMLIVLSLGGFSIFKYNSIKQTEQYNKAITAFHDNSNKVYDNSSDILSDYSTAWNEGIGTDTMFVNVSLSMADNSDYIKETDKLFKLSNKNLKIIHDAAQDNPDKYKEIYNECKKMFITTSALMDQVNEPSGSLITFNQNINQLQQEFESTNNVIEMLIDNEDIKVKSEKKDNSKL